VPLPPSTDGIDILLCLDASSSMTARDLDAARTRLDVARDAAVRFVSGRPRDRVGLLRFARYPDVVCPLTLDHAALLTFLADVRLVASDGPEDATGIGAAVARAAQLFDMGSAASRVLVLLTDGEETVATTEAPDEIATLHAAQLCERLGVRVYTIAAGVGRAQPGGTRTPLDTAQVEALAQRTGGRFFAASDAASLADIYAEIDALERAPLDEPRFRVEERFGALLAAGALLFLLSRLFDAAFLAVAP
jgi:Ca-activated chloride channel family protein